MLFTTLFSSCWVSGIQKRSEPPTDSPPIFFHTPSLRKELEGNSYNMLPQSVSSTDQFLVSQNSPSG